MGQKALVVDVTKCTACFDCFIACKDEYAGQPWLPYSEAQPDEGQYWMLVDEIERGQFPHVKGTFVPQPCMLCQDPLCVKAARDGGAYKRDDGVVVFDPIRSKGQKGIATACRYGRAYWNEQLGIPQKCDFCVHLLDKGWKEPRCVEVCPARVFTFGEKDDMKELIATAEPLHPEYKTAPAVYYIGLPKTFLSGSVFCDVSRDCLEGVAVNLVDKSSGRAVDAKTNNYGDFEFDELESGMTCRLTFEAQGYYTVAFEDIRLDRDLHLGNIYLKAVKT